MKGLAEATWGSQESLGAWQAEFTTALLDPDQSVPRRWVGPDGEPSATRFNVYRNNVMAGLTRVLHEAFPATARLVGEEFFAAMARMYVLGHPPGTPMLFDYGGSFPDFIQGFEPASELPYLADVARIERAWVEAYYAPEACPLSDRALAGVSRADLPNVRVSLHPSLRVVTSRFPALTIWQMNVNDDAPESVNLDTGGEEVLITRADAQVEVRLLPRAGAVFLQALRGGCCMLDATHTALIADPRFDLSINLTGLMHAHAFVGYEMTRPSLPC